jgi:hypothetical protein
MLLTKFVQLFTDDFKSWHYFLLYHFDLNFSRKLSVMKFRLIKKVFLPILFVTAFAACNSNKRTDTRDIQLLTDSTAYHNNVSSDSAKIRNENPVPAANIHHNESASHTSSNSEKVSKSSTSSNKGTVSKSGTSSASGTATNSGSSSTQGTQKKGWSKGAQGAVIGGATGAVGGAIISKHKGTGAAIGAAVGAAGGYIIGHEKDKKDGRIKK